MDAQERTDQLFRMLQYLKKAKALIPEVPGVPQGEFLMLYRIHHCCKEEENSGASLPGVRVSELSARMGMSMPAVSQMLKSLQKKGLVTRTAATDDRRVVYVTLTPVGAEVFSQAIDRFLFQISTVANRFGEEKIQQISRLLADLSDVVEHVKIEATENFQSFPAEKDRQA